MNKAFPDNFLWGAATSAYQVEGTDAAEPSAAVSTEPAKNTEEA